MSIGNHIKRRMREINTTQEAVSKAAGISQVSLHKLISGKTKQSRFIVDIAGALGLTAEQLKSGKWDGKVESNVSPYDKIPERIPLISFVQAGNWSETMDDFQPGDAIDFIQVPLPHSEGAFCLKVVGQSMWPEYHEGGIILVEPSLRPHHGDDIVVRTPDNNTTFKRYQVTPDGQFLLAVNPEFPSRIMVLPEGSEICGVVTGYWVDRRRHN